MQDITQTGDTYEVVNPKTLRQALTSSMLYPLSHRRQNWKRESRINIQYSVMSSYFILSENMISEKYLYYVTILKHVEITKF